MINHVRKPLPKFASSSSISFVKMHGNGNDFVILDQRGHSESSLSRTLCRAMTDRQKGIGCDQVIQLQDPKKPETSAHVRFFNQDGSESAACGNGARCVAWLLSQGSALPATVRFSTSAHVHEAQVTSLDEVTIDMGAFTQAHDEIPLSEGFDPLAVDVGIPALGMGIAVGMGNPHVIFFVEDLEAHDLTQLGPRIENHYAFPSRVNVHFVEQKATTYARQKTWERGSGLTLSCGSGACAVAAAGYLTSRWTSHVALSQPGGALACHILENNHVLLTGPVRQVFQGQWAL